MASLIKTVQHQRDHHHHRKHIIVKEHPSIPCARFYEDIFGTIIVECKDEEHNQSSSSSSSSLNKNGQGKLSTPDLVDKLDSTITTTAGSACYNDNQFRYT